MFAPLGAVEAETSIPTPRAKVTDWGNGIPNAYLFNGFEFLKYMPSADGLKEIIIDEYNAIQNAKNLDGKEKTQYKYQNMYDSENTITKPTDPYTIIGYSQGGLRALAYAGYLKQNNSAEYNNLNGVITISGIDRGLKAMAPNGGVGSIGVLRSSMMNIANTVWGGFRSSIMANIFLQYGGLDLPRNIDGTVEFVLSLFPNESPWAYIKPAIINPTDPNLKEVADMAPQSNFIKNYIMNTESYQVRTQVDTKNSLQITWKGIFPIIKIVSTPVYAYATVYNDVLKFDNTLPVGYIVGLNNNTIGMGEKSAETWARAAIYTAATGFATSSLIHVGWSVGILGLFTGSPGYAVDAAKASTTLFNIDDTLNDLKGSPQNDGLVAAESQYYPKSLYTNVLSLDPKGYTEMKDYNHADIIEAEPVKKEVEAMISRIIPK
jgi:hypothetical protein